MEALFSLSHDAERVKGGPSFLDFVMKSYIVGGYWNYSGTTRYVFVEK